MASKTQNGRGNGGTPAPFDGSQRMLAQNPLDDPRLLSGPFWGELRVFLAVAKAKSFNRAARQLGMSQPTVSRQVRRLQDVMGSQLVVSSANDIMLTDKGIELAQALIALDEKRFWNRAFGFFFDIDEKKLTIYDVESEYYLEKK